MTLTKNLTKDNLLLEVLKQRDERVDALYNSDYSDEYDKKLIPAMKKEILVNKVISNIIKSKN